MSNANPNLTQTAVLARLTISQFSNSREDGTLTKEVKTLHKLQGTAGAWRKYKLAESALAGIRKVAGEARRVHYSLTLPWEDGSRLLPLAARQSYADALTALHAQYDAAVAQFVADYPAHVDEARRMHNGTFTPSDYPAAEVVRTQFGFSVEYSPVPAASHFADTLTKPVLASMRAQLEASNAARLKTAVNDTWQRVLGPIEKLATTLADKNAIFRDTLVTNIREIVALVPALNVTGDAALARAAAQIDAMLTNIDAETLRTDKVVRRLAAEAAGSIVKSFGAVGARKFAA